MRYVNVHGRCVEDDDGLPELTLQPIQVAMAPRKTGENGKSKSGKMKNNQWTTLSPLCASLVYEKIGPASRAKRACHPLPGREWFCQCLLDRNANLVLRRGVVSPFLTGLIPKCPQTLRRKQLKEGKGGEGGAG